MVTPTMPLPTFLISSTWLKVQGAVRVGQCGLGYEIIQCQNFSGKGNTESILQVRVGIENIATDTPKGGNERSRGQVRGKKPAVLDSLPEGLSRTAHARDTVAALHGWHHRKEKRLSHSLILRLLEQPIKHTTLLSVEITCDK